MSWDDRLISLLVEAEEEVAAPEEEVAEPVKTKTHKNAGQIYDRKERARARLRRKKIKNVAGKTLGGAKTGLKGLGYTAGSLLGVVAAANKYLKDNR
jgi:hypothetical protein